MEETFIDMDTLTHEPEEIYHGKAGEYLTSHLLADFRKCPQLYQKRKLGVLGDEDRPAYQLGRATHVRILEGREKYAKKFAIGGPVNPSTGKPYGSGTKAFAEWAEKLGKPVLTQEQADLIENLAVGVAMNTQAVDLIINGVAEGVIRTDYCGIPCQIRMDWLNQFRGIVDLKTCDDLTWFEADARRYGYAYQLAFYRAVLSQSINQCVPCYFVAVEKHEPFRCGVWMVSDDTLNQCARENAAAIERMKNCERINSWPSGYEEMRVFDAI